MTRMTGPDCVVMCNLINTYIHTYIHIVLQNGSFVSQNIMITAVVVVLMDPFLSPLIHAIYMSSV